ncbi:pentapeptide repeat-containing protein [Leptolyngbya subtilissima ST-M1]|uniref:pentapeptide repeat-containing protein n=1 Tax=Cyanophyceae TaxID=3028117 RepID=UPI001F54EE37|nr:pentapeptide repeat-containing protein [Nodosilinea sp. FACHB-131]
MTGFNIKSISFAGKNLVDEKFIKARAGIKRPIYFLWIITLFFSSALLGALFQIGLAAAIPNLSSEPIDASIFFILIITLTLTTFIRGFPAAMVTSLLLVILFIFLSTILLASGVPNADHFLEGALTGLIILTVLGFGIFSLAVTVTTASILTRNWAASGITFSAVASAVLTRNIHLISIEAQAGVIISLAAISTSVYISVRALSGDETAFLVRKISIALAAVGGTSFKSANLTNADFTQAILKNTDFRNANLTQTRWHRAKGLEFARLGNTYLSDPKIQKLVVELDGQSQNFDGLNLMGVNLQKANLKNASFIGTNLNQANLRYADLSNAILRQAQLENADLRGATLTGACIADWQIGSSTKLDKINCDYVFRTLNGNEFSARLPVAPSSTFAPGEFTQRFQILASALETIDLTFTEGIDWKAFFASFQEVRSQHPNSDLSVQGLEKKAEGFVVRLEVNQEADKATIETQVKQRYSEHLQLIEIQYRQQLHAKDREIEIYKQQSTDLLELAKLAASRPIKAEATAMVNNTEGPKYNLQGAQFAGGFAETVEGNQIGGVINNYGASLEEITDLIAALREQVQTFPPEQKDNALDLIDDIETDLKKPEPDPGRLGRKLKQLAAAGTAAVTIAGGAATFSGNLNDFTGNVLDLTNKLGVPIELVQPSQGTP